MKYTEEDIHIHFLGHVDTFSSPNGCWVWTGPSTSGNYGVYLTALTKKTGRILAHRYSYEYFVGPIPSGLHLDHTCSNRLCVNPDHLEPVTMQENSRRSADRRRHFTCDHPETPENTIVYTQSRRKCLTCKLDKLKLPEYCSKGHKLTEENCYRYKDRRITCRQCRLDTSAIYNEEFKRKRDEKRRK